MYITGTAFGYDSKRVTARRSVVLVMQHRASEEAREAEVAMEIEEEGVEVDDEDKERVLCEPELVAGCSRVD